MKPYTIKQLTTTVFPLRVLKSSRPTDGNRHKLYDMETEYWANQYNKHSLKCKAAAISGHEKKKKKTFLQNLFCPDNPSIHEQGFSNELLKVTRSCNFVTFFSNLTSNPLLFFEKSNLNYFFGRYFFKKKIRFSL